MATKHHWSLMMLRIAWPIELAILIVFTLVFIVNGDIERIELWLRALPVIGMLVAGQGAVAFGGSPLKKLTEGTNKAQGGPSGVG